MNVSRAATKSTNHGVCVLVPARAMSTKLQGLAALGRHPASSPQSVKSFIDPEDIAALTVFLAGPHTRTISGQMFPIDGDSKSTV
jgi:hypothetical protein